MNNKAYLRLLTLPIVVTSLVLYASDNPDLHRFIDSANRSLRSRQFDRAINDLIPGEVVDATQRYRPILPYCRHCVLERCGKCRRSVPVRKFQQDPTFNLIGQPTRAPDKMVSHGYREKRLAVSLM